MQILKPLKNHLHNLQTQMSAYAVGLHENRTLLNYIPLTIKYAFKARLVVQSLGLDHGLVLETTDLDLRLVTDC